MPILLFLHLVYYVLKGRGKVGLRSYNIGYTPLVIYKEEKKHILGGWVEVKETQLGETELNHLCLNLFFLV